MELTVEEMEAIFLVFNGLTVAANDPNAVKIMTDIQNIKAKMQAGIEKANEKTSAKSA